MLVVVHNENSMTEVFEEELGDAYCMFVFLALQSIAVVFSPPGSRL
jgi:hypothetical protein